MYILYHGIWLQHSLCTINMNMPASFSSTAYETDGYMPTRGARFSGLRPSQLAEVLT